MDRLNFWDHEARVLENKNLDYEVFYVNMKLLFQSRFPSSVWRHADAERLVHNDRVEAIRKTEYPMLKGKYVVLIITSQIINSLSRNHLP